MTQEEKSLLLVDLCARLPYGVYVLVHDTFEYSTRPFENIYLKSSDISSLIDLISLNERYNSKDKQFIRIIKEHKDFLEFKPYLRPMLSMTKDEREEIEVFIFNEWYQEDSCKIDKEGWIEILANYDVSGIDPGFCSDYVDWLNAHHFDFRGLIERDLAIAVTKENNPYK